MLRRKAEAFNMENKDKVKVEYNNAPILETSITQSKDNKWIIHKTTITDIKPVSYMAKVLNPKA